MSRARTQARGAVIYTRVSTEDQAEHGTSLAGQRDACRQKALFLGLPIISEEEDAGLSGAYFQARPGLQAALAAIADGIADTLICYELSRLSRVVKHQQEIRDRVKAAGGSLVFCDMTFEDTAEGDLNYTIHGGFKEYEKAAIRKRTMGGRRRLAQQGIQTAMRPPYGYHVPSHRDVDRGLYAEHEFGKYVVVPEKAQVAARIFAACDGGKSLNQILRDLKAEGVPSPTGKPTWGVTTLRNILRNPVYKGTAVSGRFQSFSDESRLEKTDPLTGRKYKTLRGRRPAPSERWLILPAPAVVDEGTWDRVQCRLSANQARRGGNRGRARMLSGRILCPACGGKMAPSGYKEADGTRCEHYLCRLYAQSYGQGAEGGRLCRNTTYPIAKVEAAVTLALLEVCRQPEGVSAALAAYAPPQTDPADARRELASLDRALDQLAQQEQATVQAQIRGIMAGASPDAYADAFTQIAAQRKDMEDRRGALQRERPARRGAATMGAGRRGAEVVPETLARVIADAYTVLTSPHVTGAEKRDLIAPIIERVICQPGGADVVFTAGLFGDDTFQHIEVDGMNGDVIALQEIFHAEGDDEARPTGLRPRVLELLEARGGTPQGLWG